MTDFLENLPGHTVGRAPDPIWDELRANAGLWAAYPHPLKTRNSIYSIVARVNGRSNGSGFKFQAAVRDGVPYVRAVQS